MTAGEAPGRYVDLPERPSLGNRGRRAPATAVGLVDEWADVRVDLAWTPDAELAWGPVETVSVSEAGFERIHQGTALVQVVQIDDREEARLNVTIRIGGVV